VELSIIRDKFAIYYFLHFNTVRQVAARLRAKSAIYDCLVVFTIWYANKYDASCSIHVCLWVQLAAEYNIKFLETSAKTSVNVEEAFMVLSRDIKTKMDKKAVSCVFCVNKSVLWIHVVIFFLQSTSDCQSSFDSVSLKVTVDRCKWLTSTSTLCPRNSSIEGTARLRPDAISQTSTKCTLNLEGSLVVYASALPARGRECVYVLQSVFFAFCFFFAFFPSATTKCINMRQLFSGTAERIFMKLLPNNRGKNIVFNVIPKWGLGPRIFFGAKNWKIVMVYTVLSL